MNKLTKMALEHAQSTAPEPLRGLAAAALKREKRSRATRRERSAPRRAREATRRKERNERMAEIWRTVMRRSLGRCELCSHPATEAHHVISGPERRLEESAQTVLALCTRHHQWIHQGDVYALEQALAFCTAAGMHDAAAALVKRIDKLDEARAQHPGARAGRGGPDAP